MRVVKAETYAQELLQHIVTAKHRVTISSLTFFYDDATHPLLDALVAATQRNVKVRLVIDAYSQNIPVQIHHWNQWGEIRRKIQETKGFLRTLEQHDGVVWLHDGLDWNPFKGRLHQKIACVDDHVYFAGGVNMTADGLRSIDYMLYTQDVTLAHLLDAQLADVVAAPFVDDSEHVIDEQTKLLIDGGKPGTSLIYDRALALTEQAARVTYVSQLCPSGRLALLLKERDSSLYYNPPQVMLFPGNWYQRVMKTYYRLPNAYTRQQFLHAKCMLFELSDGRKALLSGSHNFSWRGVAYGTRELAVESYDEKLWQELQHLIAVSVAT